MLSNEHGGSFGRASRHEPLSSSISARWAGGKGSEKGRSKPLRSEEISLSLEQIARVKLNMGPL